MNTLLCKACQKEFEYNPKEYGGYSNDFSGNLCAQCWRELMDIKKRHSQELKDWNNSKKSP